MRKAREDTPGSLIVTGTSAAGGESLAALLESLPASFGAPIVVAQSAPADGLLEALRASSALRVEVVASGRTRLDPGRVYVVPPDLEAAIEDGHVVAEAGEADGQTATDRLFHTAATVYGERLIGVLLAGNGIAGASGAREIKRYGGTVVIEERPGPQSPPLSLAPSHVDVSAPPGALGTVLSDLLHGEDPARAEHDGEALRALLAHVHDVSGIDFSQYKTPTIVRRLGRLMTAEGIASFEEYTRYLEAHPSAYQRLVSSFLIKVTEFFRDAGVFEYVRDHLLPELVDVARTDHGNELRVWSAGCATGEEAYSLAILIAEYLGEDLGRLNVRIFATDLDEEAISYARRGIYPPAAVEGLSSQMLERYFTAVNDGYEVKKIIREMTVFGHHDLGQRAPFPRIDLCFCRNVLIYFTKDLQQRTLQLFAFSLRERGFLVLGKAETTSPLPEYFKTQPGNFRIYRRHGARVVMPPARNRELPSAARDRSLKRIAASFAPGKREGGGRPPLAERIGNYFMASPLGVVVIDKNYDVRTINPAARALLNIHGIAIGDDLLHVVSGIELNPLRRSIDGAFTRDTRGIAQELTVQDLAEPDGERTIEIMCFPDRGFAPDAQVGSRTEFGVPDGVILVIVDRTREARERRAVELDLNSARAELVQLRSRNDELTQRQRALLAANQELTNANIELRSINEHLVIGSEEAESSSEEIETLNEEMQATNEELETLNEELQATVEELNTTNDELNARSSELSLVAKGFDLQRQAASEALLRAEALLEVLPQPVVIYDIEGNRHFANRAFHDITARPSATYAGADGKTVPAPPHATERTRFLIEGDGRYEVIDKPLLIEDKIIARAFLFNPVG